MKKTQLRYILAGIHDQVSFGRKEVTGKIRAMRYPGTMLGLQECHILPDWLLNLHSK